MKALPSMIFSAIASFYYSQELLDTLRRSIAPEAGLTLLDIPCGTGTLMDICLPCTYTGLDVDAGRVEKARLENGHRGTFQVGDASALDFPDNSFDRMLVSGLFHHVDDATAHKILAEFARVLKIDGKIILFDAIWPRKWYNLFGGLAREMDQGDFVRLPSQYNAMFNRYFTITDQSFPHRMGLDYILETLVNPRKTQVHR